VKITVHLTKNIDICRRSQEPIRQDILYGKKASVPRRNFRAPNL